jgi:hypothetical protein
VIDVKADTLRKALEKATFMGYVDEPVIVCDGGRAEIAIRDVGNSRIAHIRFPFEVEGRWGISDPAMMIKKLKNIKGDMKVATKGDKLHISGKGKSYKFPVVNDLCVSRSISTITPILAGSSLYFQKQDGSKAKAVDLEVVFKPGDSKLLKDAIKSEVVYQLQAIMRVSSEGILSFSGQDDTDFEATDEVTGKVLVGEGSNVYATYTGLDELAKVLGSDILIAMGTDEMVYIEETDGDVEASYVIMPIREG